MNDPWKDISVPAVDGTLSARRVDASHPYDFFWAKDFRGNCALVMRYADTITVKDKRPRLEEIEFADSSTGTGNKNLGLVLLAAADKEIFVHLCQDIMDSTRDCKNEQSALAVMIRRTWRWHRMLKSVSDRKLGPEAQKGLIGELWFLREFLFSRYSPSESIDFWLGPEGSPKDFAIGNTFVEVKARRGSARPYVSISSEHQLDDSGQEKLYLFVLDVNSSTVHDEGSFYLNRIVQEIVKLIIERDAGVLGQFEAKLAEAGYYDEHDYSDRIWIVGGFQFFEVHDDFPRIAGSDLPSGIQDVGYKLQILQCKDFQASVEDFSESLDGEIQ